MTLASLNGLVPLTHRIRPVSAKLGIRPIWEAVPFRSASPQMALPTPPGQSAALDLVPPSSSSLSPSTAPVVTGTGPNFSLGELQGHLAYDLNPASTGMRRTLPSTSSSGYVPGAPPLGTSRPPPHLHLAPAGSFLSLFSRSTWETLTHLSKPSPQVTLSPALTSHAGLPQPRVLQA